MSSPAALARTPPRPRVFTLLPQRLVSLDAYRGFVMLAMVSGGLGLHTVAREKLTASPNDPVWQAICFHTEHVLWEGCSFWDLIQPSFMFMVGVAMPYSIASRLAKGESYGKMLWHAAWRAGLL